MSRRLSDRARRLIAIGIAAFVVVVAGVVFLAVADPFAPSVSPQATTAAGEPVRAFHPSSYWNTPVPDEAPVHPSSDEIIGFLTATNARAGCVMLVGAEENDWGTPVYWAESSDPVYEVRSGDYPVPPEFSELSIPPDARPAPNTDSEMVVYDVDRGHVAHLSKAAYDPQPDRWTVTGGSIAYLDSNGLDSRLDASDEERNTGSFRGYNGAVAVVRHDLVAAGNIGHVLKVAVSESHQDHVFPMVASDGDSTDSLSPPQGARLRIRPDVDLDDFGLAPQALVIARALQSHGAIIADSSGGPIALKLEDTVSQGRGQLWDLGPEALCGIPLDRFEVLEYGYVPPAAEAG